MFEPFEMRQTCLSHRSTQVHCFWNETLPSIVLPTHGAMPRRLLRVDLLWVDAHHNTYTYGTAIIPASVLRFGAWVIAPFSLEVC